MDGMAPEDALILGVALIIVLNRVFTSTSLKLLRPAYAGIQVFNLVTMAVLLRFRLEGYPPKLELSIRVFLMFFVAWHMVLANQSRARALRLRVDERRERERMGEERDKRLQQLAEWDASAAAVDPPAVEGSANEADVASDGPQSASGSEPESGSESAPGSEPESGSESAFESDPESDPET